MEIFRICAVGIVTAFCVVVLKENKSDLSLLTGIAGGAIILAMTAEYIGGIFSAIQTLIDKSGVGGEIFSVLAKIIGMGYVVDFSSGIVEDAGLKSLAEKVVTCGKVMILTMALPLLVKVFEIMESLIAV